MTTRRVAAIVGVAVAAAAVAPARTGTGTGIVIKSAAALLGKNCGAVMPSSRPSFATPDGGIAAAPALT